MRPFHLRRVLKHIGDNKINTDSIYKATVNINLKEYKCRVDGVAFKPNDIISHDTIESNTYLSIPEIKSPEIKIVDPVKDLLYDDVDLPTRMIQNTLIPGNYNIVIAFNHNQTSNPRFSGTEDTWRTLTKLFDRNGKYSVYISGLYPFKKKPLSDLERTTILENINIPDCNTSELKMEWAFVNSHLVVCKNPAIAITALHENTKVLFYGSEVDVSTIKDSISKADKSLYRLIINPNPNIHPVVLFDEIRDFLGEKKKVQ